MRPNKNENIYWREDLTKSIDDTLRDNWYITHISYTFPGATAHEEVTMIGSNKYWINSESSYDKYVRQCEEARKKHIKEVQELLDEIFDNREDGAFTENMDYFQGKIDSIQ